MKPFERRVLTEREIALGRIVYDGEIDWARVRVAQVPPVGFVAMAPFRHTLIFSRHVAAQDFATAPAKEQGLFMHELAHVWQAARGIVLPAAKLFALGRAAYLYKPRPGAAFADYNIESQAEIARHLFHARQGAPDPKAAPHDWLEHVWATR